MPTSRPWFGFLLAGMLVAAGQACSNSTANVGETGTFGGGGSASTHSGGSGAGHSGSGSGTGGFTGSGGGTTCFKVSSIDLTPGTKSVSLDGGPTPSITFTAKGGGQTLPAAQLGWSVSRADDTDPGSISNGVFQPNPGSGGVVTVKAQDTCGHAGTATVTFDLDATVGTPSDPVAWSSPPVTGGTAPPIVYPSDQTRFPRNIFRTLFQWRAGTFTQFRLNFVGPYASVSVYTDGVHPSCATATPKAGCWEVDEATWNFIAGSNAGATAVWTVDALDTSTTPPTVRRSSDVTLGFSKQDVKGAIFYWSTTSAGVRRAAISEQDPEDYITGKPMTTYPDGDQVQCVACHVVSRDGKYMAAPVQAKSGQSLWIMEVTKDPPPTPDVKAVAGTKGHGFATISPDDALVVAAWGGKMWGVDRATGAKLADLVTGPLGGTQPDFSPNGDEVVFATGNGDSPSGSSLARIPYTAGTWGTAAVFVPPPAGKSNLFPMFSPNADWVAFSQGKGGHGDLTAQLFIANAADASTIELVAANRVVSNQTTTGQFENSQPTWAPPGDYHWVAFNSQREYGVVSKAGTQQIWVAAVDLSKASQGVDPSFPAFRVPFQGLTENNHRAYWTLDIRQTGTGGGSSSSSSASGTGGGGPTCGTPLTTGQTCDPLNDCCVTTARCDTNDSGATYLCVAKIIQ